MSRESVVSEVPDDEQPESAIPRKTNGPTLLIHDAIQKRPSLRDARRRHPSHTLMMREVCSGRATPGWGLTALDPGRATMSDGIALSGARSVLLQRTAASPRAMAVASRV